MTRRLSALVACLLLAANTVWAATIQPSLL
jgi:hypothetical protein